MATDTSEAELVHPKALPLRVGAQLIHADKLGEVEDNTMPIRRAVNSTRETPPKSKLAEGEEEKPEPDVSSEESASTGEEQENETPPATSSETEQPKEPEKEEKGENKPSEETKKDEKDQTKEKEKKVKKTIPSWATLSASQLARAQKQTHMAASSRPKMDAILTEAIKACFQKTGASVVAIRKYIIHKYPSLELERRGYLLKQALKRELQRGVIRQVKGKGASGSFVVVPNAGKTVQKSKDRKKSSSTLAPEQQVKLEDVLPLAFTRLCEPKEASYSLIRKYVSQYYPKLKVDIRPQLLKNALQRAVEKGQLEQITGKGASGTFQLKRSGEKPLLGGSLMEDAILSAIAAMNEPKTCSTTALKKYVLENHPGTNSNFQVHLLKRTLQKCEKNGWMEQISGKGFSGTFQLCFPYYPSPGVLFPEKQQDEESEESEDDDSEEEDEEDSSEEEESEEDEPPPKKRLQKKAPAKSRGKTTSVKQRESKPKPKTPAAQRGKARPPPKKAPPKAKTPAKKTKPAPPAIKKSGNISSKKPAASGRKDGKSSTKGKSRKSLRAKK
ncbi:heterochromatin protein 1-binding protein 3 isoform X1 [Sarcophilus harrisii]|uniref:Heterochromatin protein 1-binding protein 3 n=1 Tax=Sarcophilus harrisii TaxID=9305 RepID=A0A7N4NUD0_SARHA|nr:heterochromatin protein 1-binding protein 3 isoform X1 [Sarcophilus harrisii]XP_031818552.1 heterochromatin protein 1-binding protein 3 isoform X1 [Sarcophilus harrisii]XP_031818553.1 heterochromatin protein 1-binding protein 3 isoform X1 [Sarcophilus harrisii]XP_031818554.1 heterochromatin protein 1-binding protein 3 isoform X1 [Sarcophilus harrisii]